MMCYIFKGQAFTGIQKVNQFIETTIESKSNWNALLRTAQSGFTLNESEYGTLEKITDDVFLSKDNRLSS